LSSELGSNTFHDNNENPLLPKSGSSEFVGRNNDLLITSFEVSGTIESDDTTKKNEVTHIIDGMKP